MSYKFSICVPTHNRRNDLVKCIQSIKSAIDYAGINDLTQIVVSNNPGDDNTEEYLNDLVLEETYNYTIHTNETNIGAVRNIYKLIELSKGEWLLFLTDDDMLVLDSLKELMTTLREKSLKAVVLNKLTYFINTNKITYNIIGNKIDAIFKSNVLSGTVLKKNVIELQSLEKRKSVYPHVEILSLLYPSITYINKPLIYHKWENELYWTLDVKSENNSHENHLRSDFERALSLLDHSFLTKKDREQIIKSMCLATPRIYTEDFRRAFGKFPSRILIASIVVRLLKKLTAQVKEIIRL